jgi:type II secretion system protein I
MFNFQFSVPRPASGFSLLEVMLALAILGGAVVVLGEAARFGLENARFARDLSHAQLLCESTMAELAVGSALPEPVEAAFLADGAEPTQPVWLYSVETESTDQQGLLGVRVTVFQDLPPAQRPVECSLVRWIVDPEIQILTDQQTQTQQTQSN